MIPDPAPQPLVQLDGIVKRFGAFTANDRVTLTVNTGTWIWSGQLRFTGTVADHKLLFNEVFQPIKKIEKLLETIIGEISIFANLPFHKSNLEEAIQKLQLATETWSNLLSASGAKLELKKCFYYTMFWKFTPEGNAELMTITDQKELSGAAINIIDPDNSTRGKVLQKECNITRKTLGVYKTKRRLLAQQLI